MGCTCTKQVTEVESPGAPSSAAILAQRFKELEAAKEEESDIPPLFLDLVAECGGCVIEDTAHRAITLNQLHCILEHVQRRLKGTLPCTDGLNTFTWNGEMIPDESWQLNPEWTEENADEKYKYIHDSGMQMYGYAHEEPEPKASNICAHCSLHKSTHGEVLSYLPDYEGAKQRTIQTVEEANLYDLNALVIKPATQRRHCSLVEIMASEAQIPDYFVSHWWGEEVVKFVACLKRHCEDRGLEEAPVNMFAADEHTERGRLCKASFLGGCPAKYWVCAYANNQWDVGGDVGGDLAQTSFARAMALSKGTVSVLDTNGTSWTRIWCVYELFFSLVNSGPQYTYDMYTAVEEYEYEYSWDLLGHFSPLRSAVGIIDGLAAVDETAEDKGMREKFFPMELLALGMAVKCHEGQASVEADKVRILKSIGSETDWLDATVHGRVAAAGLRRGLEEGGEQAALYLMAIQQGHLRKLELDMKGSDADTEETMCELCKALSATPLASLELETGLALLPEGFAELKSLQSLTLAECNELTALPGGFGKLTNLKKLNLYYCGELQTLPEGIGELKSLQTLILEGCYNLKLPAALEAQLKARGCSIKT